MARSLREVPAEQVLARLRSENPWWQTGEIDPFYRRMSQRAYFARFSPLVKQVDVRRAVVLMGPRRVGKTVLLYQVIQDLLDEGLAPSNLCYVSLEQPLYNAMSLDDLFELFRSAIPPDLERGPIFFFVDEIQYLRDWEIHLKRFVDDHADVKCVVSGSAAAALRLKSMESGAGRFTDFLLPPLTFHEYLDLKDLSDLVVVKEGSWSCNHVTELNREFIDYLNYGGYPEVLFSETIRNDMGRYIRSDIIEKVLLRDLPSLYGIQDIQELNSLFTTLAYNTAGEVTLESLSTKSGVSKVTLKRYIEYLEAAFLIKTVDRIDKSAKRFKRQNYFKVYLTNPSMRSALFAPMRADEDGVGSLVETAAFAQWFHAHEKLYYARFKGGEGEVDIVGLNSQELPEWCVEVKWSDRYPDRIIELKGLAAFCRQHPNIQASVTTRSNFGAAVIGGVTASCYPASLYCYIVGRNLVAGRSMGALHFAG